MGKMLFPQHFIYCLMSWMCWGFLCNKSPPHFFVLALKRLFFHFPLYFISFCYTLEHFSPHTWLFDMLLMEKSKLILLWFSW